MTEVKVLTPSTLARRLKIEPKHLRTIMRANGMHAPKRIYAWKESDAALAKIAAIVAEARKAQAAKAN